MKPRLSFPLFFATLIVIAFLSSPQSSTLHAASASDDEAPGVRLVETPGSGRRARVVVDDSGTTHVVYASAGNLFYARRARDAAAFSDPIQVNTIDKSGAAANLAVDGSGAVHVVYHGNIFYVRGQIQKEDPDRRITGQDIRYTFYSRLPAGADAFEPQRNLSGDVWGFDGSCAIAADDADTVYVFINGTQEPGTELERDIFLLRSTDGGDAFEAPRGVGLGLGVCMCCHLSATADASGHVSFVYRVAEDRVDRDSYAMRSTDGGDSFTAYALDQWKLNACPGSVYSFAGDAENTLVSWRTEQEVFFKKVGMKQAISPKDREFSRRAASLARRADGWTLFAWAEGESFGKPHDLRWRIYDAEGQPVGAPGVEANAFERWGNPMAYVDGEGEFAIMR